VSGKDDPYRGIRAPVSQIPAMSYRGPLVKMWQTQVPLALPLDERWEIRAILLRPPDGKLSVKGDRLMQVFHGDRWPKGPNEICDVQWAIDAWRRREVHGFVEQLPVSVFWNPGDHFTLEDYPSRMFLALELHGVLSKGIA
jgi:hypothetical protein